MKRTDFKKIKKSSKRSIRSFETEKKSKVRYVHLVLQLLARSCSGKRLFKLPLPFFFFRYTTILFLQNLLRLRYWESLCLLHLFYSIISLFWQTFTFAL